MDPEPEDERTHAGGPDGFERLWTPHRMVYIAGGDAYDKPVDGGAGRQCPFCRVVDSDDETALVVARGKSCYAVLNLYPYNPGHVLVCPYRHVADYTDLTGAETLELAEMTQATMRVIRSVASPHGFNLGLNQGPVAGAGIAAHLHQHVVPRWNGDSNFLPIVARTKALPELLSDTRRRIASAWVGGGSVDD